jgi:CRISPR/Cas system-associated exonuclease Cas4 (RecB family)
MIQITSETLRQGIDRYLDRAVTTYAPKTHHISSVGHPCARCLYYQIHNWQDKAPPSKSLQAIFTCGKKVEMPILCHFNENVGPLCEPSLQIIEQQRSVSDKLLNEYNISGVMDGVLAIDTGDRYLTRLGPIDAKTCSANMFRMYQETDIETLKRTRWSYKYIAQIMLYAFAENFDRGYIFFISKQNPYYDWKIIEVKVDMGYLDEILARVKHVNECLEMEEEPERINQPFWCKECDFEHICLPELEASGEGDIINENRELQDMFTRSDELKPFFSEYNSIQKRLKSMLVKGRRLIMDNCVIDWTHVSVPEKTVKAYEYDRMKILPFTEEKVDEEE